MLTGGGSAEEACALSAVFDVAASLGSDWVVFPADEEGWFNGGGTVNKYSVAASKLFSVCINASRACASVKPISTN